MMSWRYVVINKCIVFLPPYMENGYYLYKPPNINHNRGPSRSYLFSVVFYLNWFISIGKPWTLQYFVQHLLTKLLIFPTLFNGCRCNKETLASIKQAGFKTVQAEKGWLQWSSEAISKPLNPFTFLLVRGAFAVVNSGIAGFAEKWQVYGLNSCASLGR